MHVEHSPHSVLVVARTYPTLPSFLSSPRDTRPETGYYLPTYLPTGLRALYSTVHLLLRTLLKGGGGGGALHA